MAKIHVKCPNCNEVVLTEENEDAGICSNCNKAFITEKAITLYSQIGEEQNKKPVIKKRHVWKSLGKGLLMALECFGYLIYVVCCLWLFFDILDDIKKK